MSLINRAVASLTVPGGQEFHFPHFFLKFQSIFHIFPQTLPIFFLILALRVGESPTREGPGYATAGKEIQKNQNTAKNSKIGYTITRWRPINHFPSRDLKFPTKNEKTTFPKEFFLEIWLIIEDSKYNYTVEIKFEKKSYSVALLWREQILNSALIVLIYAN